MTDAIRLYTPHVFKERFLLFGPGGGGKSTAVLDMARHIPTSKFWISDTDYSASYQRLLETEFTDVRDNGNVVVQEISEWTDFDAFIQRVIKEGDDTKDFYVQDTVSWCWQEVQSYYNDLVYGDDIADHMVKLRASVKDASEFMAAQAVEGNWQIINKIYQRKFLSRFHKWHGHAVLVAEAEETTKKDSQDEVALYGSHGMKPRGQKLLHHITHTIILMDSPRINNWRMTVVKDRGRQRVEKVKIEEGFAMDYLRGVAGWKVERPV